MRGSSGETVDKEFQCPILAYFKSCKRLAVEKSCIRMPYSKLGSDVIFLSR